MINMINVNDVRTNLEALANKIEASDINAAIRLRNLSSAVGNGPNADAWAASNVHQLIEPELIIENYKSQPRTERVIGLLEWLRNTLIFAPLVVTWYGISQAVEQYNALVTSDPNSITQPFLYLWQNGFGGRLQGWQTLGSLATIDFALLATVLGLTIAVYSLSNGVRMRREQEAEELRSTLAHAISGASLCLTTRNWQQPTNMITRFDQTSAKFNQVISQVLTQIETLTERQKNDLQAFMDFKKDLTTIMSTVSTAVTELKNSNDALRRSMASLVKPTTDVSNHMGVVGQSAQQAVTLYGNQIAALEAVVRSQQQWGTNLEGVLTNLTAVVRTALDMTQKVDTFTNKQTHLVAAMENERNQQAQISNRVLMATDSLAKVVAQIDACSNELRGLNIQISDLTRRLASAMAVR